MFLHAFATSGSILGPWPTVVLGLLMLAGSLRSRRTPTDVRFRNMLVLSTVVLVVAVALVNLAVTPEVRHWVLD